MYIAHCTTPSEQYYLCEAQPADVLTRAVLTFPIPSNASHAAVCSFKARCSITQHPICESRKSKQKKTPPHWIFQISGACLKCLLKLLRDFNCLM